MRRPPPDPAPALDAASWARWGAAAVGVALLFFLVRFVLLGDLAFVSPEECHTGAIASELLAHGFRFPFRAYTPVPYENGIVVEGLLTVPFFALLGENALALKLAPHAASVVLALASVALQRRVLDQLGVVDRRARAVGAAALVLALALSPAAFTFKFTEAVGDHLEATTLSLLLLLLLARRIERPSVGRFASLWALAGLFSFWQKGTLLATCVAGVYELSPALAAEGRLPRWRVPAALAIFSVAYLPSLAMHEASGFQDLLLLASKVDLGGPRGEVLLWVLVDRNPVLLAVVLGSLAWYLAVAARTWRARSLLHALALYALLHALLMGVTASDSYYLYGYPVLAIPPTVGVARAVERALGDARLPRRAAVVPALALLLVVAVMAPRLRPRWGRPAELLRDTDRAACFWRFGQAFQVATGDDRTAADWCRRLGGARSLECLSGLAMQATTPAALARSPAERQAIAFGTGRMRQHSHHGSASCADYGGDERVTCEAGDAFECLVYADMVSTVTGQPRLRRPACLPPVPPPGRYFRAFAASEVAASLASGGEASPGACARVASRCVRAR